MPTRRKSRASETTLSKAIQESLTLKGIKVIRIQAGILPVLKGGKTAYVHCAPNGTPDLLAITPMLSRSRLRAAELTFLEVKTPTGALTKEQAAWHQWARVNGVRVAVVRSVGEAVEAVFRFGEVKA